MRLHRQQGAALVEMSFVLIIFLMIIFAVLEFSIAMFSSAKLDEATRYGLRHAIVNKPLTPLTACPDYVSVEFPVKGCGTEECDDMITSMVNIAPLINIQPNIKVTVEYSCPASGSPELERDDIYLVTVTLSDAVYQFVLPELLGMGATINLPRYKSTRLSEDLHTVTVVE